MAFPLTQLDETQEEMGKFMRSHLEELRSQQETSNLIEELSSRITGAEYTSYCAVNLSDTPRLSHSF